MWDWLLELSKFGGELFVWERLKSTGFLNNDMLWWEEWEAIWALLATLSKSNKELENDVREMR